MECKYCKIVSAPRDIVYQTKYWKAKLSDDQTYLGRCFILSVRHAENLSELNDEEWLDFSTLVKTLETGIKKAFGAEMFNWECLMNNAYNVRKPIAHTHWHMRPRYRKPVEILGVKFTDKDFGRRYDRRKDRILPRAVREEIISKMKENMPQKPG
ncbi:MAG TPA: HIT family protein [Candidatus Aquilonibacter sp.]|nr:HIT family protein [Candidatus Aquilonibacter sp.]